MSEGNFGGVNNIFDLKCKKSSRDLKFEEPYIFLGWLVKNSIDGQTNDWNMAKKFTASKNFVGSNA